MKAAYPVKEKNSFKQNVMEILPEMFDNMMEHKTHVAGRPRMKTALHRMRIAGKPIRYVMEIMQPTFGREFTKCLSEIKNMLELMGSIHDCDVFISELRDNLSEIRKYNLTKIWTGKIVTSGIVSLISDLAKKRNDEFEKLNEIFRKWERWNFRNNLVRAMQSDRTNELNYFNQKSTQI